MNKAAELRYKQTEQVRLSNQERRVEEKRANEFINRALENKDDAKKMTFCQEAIKTISEFQHLSAKMMVVTAMKTNSSKFFDNKGSERVSFGQFEKKILGVTPEKTKAVQAEVCTIYQK